MQAGGLTFLESHKDGSNGVDGLDGAFSIAISADGRNVYAASRTDSAVAVFSRDADTGALTFEQAQKDGVDGIDGLGGSVWVEVSTDGRNVYAAGRTDAAVAVFGRCNNASMPWLDLLLEP